MGFLFYQVILSMSYIQILFVDRHKNKQISFCFRLGGYLCVIAMTVSLRSALEWDEKSMQAAIDRFSRSALEMTVRSRSTVAQGYAYKE
jgi:hypothetical protein